VTGFSVFVIVDVAIALPPPSVERGAVALGYVVLLKVLSVRHQLHAADIIVLGPDNPVIAGREGEAVIDSWIFSGNRPAVRNVYVGGVQLVRDGQHFKQDDIFRRYRAALDRLRG